MAWKRNVFHYRMSYLFLIRWGFKTYKISLEVYRQYTEKYSVRNRKLLLWWADRKDHPYSLVPEMLSRKVCGEKDLKPGSLLLRLDALGVYEKLEDEVAFSNPASK